jgi:hypothetical protein
MCDAAGIRLFRDMLPAYACGPVDFREWLGGGRQGEQGWDVYEDTGDGDRYCDEAPLFDSRTEAEEWARSQTFEHGYSVRQTDEEDLHPDNRKLPDLDWIVAGGESGPKARPAHPDWFRSVRDQCKAAGVPFLFKQWGEWAEVDSEAANDATCRPGALQWTHMVSLATGRAFVRGQEMPIHEAPTMAFMRNVGKTAAGRELDGVTHDEFPEVTP